MFFLVKLEISTSPLSQPGAQNAVDIFNATLSVAGSGLICSVLDQVEKIPHLFTQTTRVDLC